MAIATIQAEPALEKAMKVWNAEHKAASLEMRPMLAFELAKEASKNPDFMDAILKRGSKELRAECADVLKMLSKMESDKARGREYASMAGKMVG